MFFNVFQGEDSQHVWLDYYTTSKKSLGKKSRKGQKPLIAHLILKLRPRTAQLTILTKTSPCKLLEVTGSSQLGVETRFVLHAFLKFTIDIASHYSHYITSGYTHWCSSLQRARLQVSAACKTQLRDCLTLYVVESLREFPHMQEAWVIHDNISHCSSHTF